MTMPAVCHVCGQPVKAGWRHITTSVDPPLVRHTTPCPEAHRREVA